jgi:hypothetical protein
MTIDDEVFTDLKASLEWALTLELSDEQRARIAHLCHKIAGAQPSHLGGSRRSQTRGERLRLS